MIQEPMDIFIKALDEHIAGQGKKWLQIGSYIGIAFGCALLGDREVHGHLRLSEKGPVRLLPEDFAMRGLLYVKDYYPDEWFNAEMEEDPRYFELSSMIEERRHRIISLGYRIATAGNWLVWDAVSQRFSVPKSLADEDKLLAGREPSVLSGIYALENDRSQRASHDESETNTDVPFNHDLEACRSGQLEDGLLGLANLRQLDLMYMKAPRYSEQSLYCQYAAGNRVHRCWQEIIQARTNGGQDLADKEIDMQRELLMYRKKMGPKQTRD
ncbi:hypothetical protein FZEAL_1474 [Fusarium zealandicum]|uniref:Uncharacterized protein n=1 Tax=Fusarium zealandicum TaxID=1053134 RepID=A0A8H4UTC5_9HYPO|nr:hypothetical protein FZEAL_1474 [Fusarium zealandicum]